MSCGHCVAAVQAALKTVAGVRSGQVAVGAAQLVLDPTAGTADAIAAAIEAIHDAGYDARVVSDSARASAGATARPAGLPVMGSCCGPRG
jgi:copper chaperone CopZ